jgi:hypothetical protein
MGAHEYSVFARGQSERFAFFSAVQAALDEHGKDGYTGTIAEKYEFVRVGFAASRDEAMLVVNEMMVKEDPRAMDKWGPACSIQIEWPKKNERDGLWLFFGTASW